MTPKRFKPKSRRLKPKRSLVKKVLKNRFLWFGLAGLCVFCAIVYGIFFTPVFQIQHIEITGAEKVSVERIEHITQEYIQKKVLFFSINNIFFADEDNVARQAQEEFPSIEHIDVQTKFPNKVHIVITERGGVTIWCQKKSYEVEISDAPIAESDVNNQESAARSFRQCFATDSNGVIFEKKEPENEIILSSNNTEAVLGDRVIDPTLLLTILDFEKEMNSSELFAQAGLRVLSAHVVSEERVNAKISEGWEIYFNPAKDMSWQVTKIKLVLEQEIPKEKRSQLEYIDLRFGDQAYIKYR
jgi:cell division septal protein FtsQ